MSLAIASTVVLVTASRTTPLSHHHHLSLFDLTTVIAAVAWAPPQRGDYRCLLYSCAADAHRTFHTFASIIYRAGHGAHQA
eukprot:21323-Heterococcus_DN1.PRE.3